MINKELQKRLLSSLIILPVALFFLIKGSIFFIFFLSILFLATSYEWIKMIKRNDLLKILGIIFLILSFYSAYQLRNIAGFKYFLLLVLICIFTDIGGYIFGKIFKGPRLTKISPSKTYAGMIGSYILSIISIFLIIKFLDVFNIISINFNIKIFLFIFVVSTVSQIGDLIISFFKRLSKIKDTGKIIPGHGGLLDRIDGMIFAFPLAYVLLLTNFFK